MTSHARPIAGILLLLLSMHCAIASAQNLINIPDYCSDGEARITTPDGRLFVCSLESGLFEDFTPPSRDAIWPISISDGYAPPVLTERRPERWDFRAMLSINLMDVDAVQTFEFDEQARIVAIDGNAIDPTHLSEFSFHGVDIWPRLQVFYRVSSASDGRFLFKNIDDYTIFRDRIGHEGFVVDNGNLCPAISDGGGFWYLVHNPMEMALNGNCGRAIKRAAGPYQDEFYSYPGSDYTIPADRQIRWTFQRHGEPPRPLRDDKGNCHLYCDSQRSGPALD